MCRSILSEYILYEFTSQPMYNFNGISSVKNYPAREKRIRIFRKTSSLVLRRDGTRIDSKCAFIYYDNDVIIR